MQQRILLRIVGSIVLLCLSAGPVAPVWAQQPNATALTEKRVREAIERGKQYLIQQQGDNGSWSLDYTVGKTSLAVMTLINCGMTLEDEPIQRGLKFLRTVRDPDMTYEISLQIMALAAAKDGNRDASKILALSTKLASLQKKVGKGAGGWSYTIASGRGGGIPDRSNSQFAVLALREAQYANIGVDREIWELIRNYWTDEQSADGGWHYQGMNTTSTGSMTVAGVTTQVIVETMLRDEPDENADGSPNCCGQPVENDSLERGIKWLERHFSVGHNPGMGGSATLYYLYGLERAGRLSGRRFFGSHDWYREGAEFLIQIQSERDGSWIGGGISEREEVVATSFALLFLSKGLAPVLINKLQYEPENPDKKNDPCWNRHRHDIRNLTELISGLPGWPKLITWQQLEIGAVAKRGGLEDLMVSPILYISGDKAPKFTPAEQDLLRQYVLNGGFILGVATCTKTEFDRGFRNLVKQMYPNGENQFKRLTSEHPVFRSEYLLDAEATELWGVDVGCRTSIMYSPYDLACLWDKWNIVEPPKRTVQMKSMISKSARVGVNIVAYATGREPPSSLPEPRLALGNAANEEIERGFLQVAKLRHTGGWDAAPNAVRNLLVALNSYAGVTANTKVKNITPVDESLPKYPLVYMHGRNTFNYSKQEVDRLRLQLDRGAMLFADACCASPQFDKSFRDLVKQLYPNHTLQRIPANHEIFSTRIGHDLHDVKRRDPNAGDPEKPFSITNVVGEPFLEAVEINGSFVIVYSKYDLSCALERQASAACAGYLTEDAVKIAVNVVLYSILRHKP